MERTLEETKELLKKYFDKWLKPLGLLWWNVTIVYYDDPASIIDLFRSNIDPNELASAKTYTYWCYGSAQIRINLPSMQEESEEDLEKIVVHELLHILVNEMREDGIEHEERVVTQLQKAVMWVYEAGREDTHA